MQPPSTTDLIGAAGAAAADQVTRMRRLAMVLVTLATGFAAPAQPAASLDHPPEPVPATTCIAEPRTAADLDAVFGGRPGGISGADYLHAYALGDGRTLWLAQDVFFGDDDDLTGDAFAHNGGLVQDGGCFTALHTPPPGAQRSWVGADLEVPLTRWFWPLDGELGADGRLWVFFAEMHNPNGTGAANGAVPVATWVARIDPRIVRVETFAPATQPDERLFGWSVASDSTSTYLYSHCYRQFVPPASLQHDTTCTPHTYLARVPRGRFDQPLEYRTATGWSAEPSAAISVFSRGIANPVSVQRHNGRWVNATKVDDWWGDTLVVDVADEPWGPWTTVQAITVASRCGSACTAYGAALLDWVDADGRLQVAVSHNAWDMPRDAYPDARRYRPGIIAVDPPTPANTAASVPAGLLPLTPTRLADTREGTGVRPGVVRVGEILEVAVAGRGGVPADARAAVVNVTVVDPAAAGYVTTWPCGSSPPWASSVNYAAREVVANGVHAALGAGGAICMSTSAATHLVVDVTAALVDEGVGFHPIAGWRALDTRTGAPVAAGEDLAVVAAGVGPVPAEAIAVTVNVTAVNAHADGYLTAWPCDRPRPWASTVNVTAGGTRPNGTTVAVAADGTVCVHSQRGADVVVDVTGWWGPGGNTETAQTPVRVLDTREQGTKPATGSVIRLPLTGDLADAGAVAATVTVTGAEADGFVTVWPCGAERPWTSALNFRRGATTSNNLAVGVGEADSVCLYTMAATHLVVDVSAVLGPPGSISAP